MKSKPDTLTAGLFALRRRTLLVAALVALCLLILGWALRPDTRPGVVLLGIATSVLAAVGLAVAAVDREEFSQRVLDLGVQQIFDDRLKDLDETLWPELLAKTKREFRVLGMANHGYINSEEAQRETRDALSKALDGGNVEVQFLWLDPDHNLARLREEEEGGRGLRRDTCESILFFWNIREELPLDRQNRFSMREYWTVPTCGLSLADDYMVVTHYLAGELNLRAPGVILRRSVPRYERLYARFRKGKEPNPSLAKKYMSNYQEISGERWSREITADRIERLQRLRTELEDQQDKQSEAELRRDGE